MLVNQIVTIRLLIRKNSGQKTKKEKKKLQSFSNRDKFVLLVFPLIGVRLNIVCRKKKGLFVDVSGFFFIEFLMIFLKVLCWNFSRWHVCPQCLVVRWHKNTELLALKCPPFFFLPETHFSACAERREGQRWRSESRRAVRFELTREEHQLELTLFVFCHLLNSLTAEHVRLLWLYETHIT